MKYIRKDKFTKPYSPVEVLEMALAKEKSSVDFYDKMAGRVGAPGLKGLLTKLKKIEEGHVQLIKRELER